MRVSPYYCFLRVKEWITSDRQLSEEPVEEIFLSSLQTSKAEECANSCQNVMDTWVGPQKNNTNIFETSV